MNEVRKKGSLIRVLCVFFSLCCEKERKKEKKKKILVPNRCSSFFREEEVTRRELLPVFVFLPRVRGFSFWATNSEHLSSSASHSETSKAIFQTKRLRHTKRASAYVVRVLFFLFDCLQRFASGQLLRARIHSHTSAERAKRRSLKSAATLFPRARARCGKFKPVKVLFFSNDNVLKK